MWRDFRLALSFANLVYLRAWADLIPLRSEGLYIRKSVPGFSLYFALVGDVLSLSVLIFLAIRAVPRLPEWLRRLWPAMAISVLSLSVRFLGAHLPPVIPRIVPIALLSLATLLALWCPTVAAKGIGGFTLAATPCLVVTFVAPLFYLSGPSPLPRDPPLAARLAGSPPVRVIWMGFYDWDQRLTFGDPNGGPEFQVGLPSMPTLTLLVNRSFTARRALAAQAGSTPVYNMATLAAKTRSVTRPKALQSGISFSPVPASPLSSARATAFFHVYARSGGMQPSPDGFFPTAVSSPLR